VAGETAGGFHPVLASAGSNLGAISLSNLVTTNHAWSTTSRNTMTCTDCHGSDSIADPNGPHGSSANFILKGPNTTWNNTLALNGTNPVAGAYCWNCHSNSYAGSRFAFHTDGAHQGIACFNCHAAVPHGGPRPGMLISNPGASAGVGGSIGTWDTSALYWQGGTTSRLYLKSYPATSSAQWSASNCGCNQATGGGGPH
jgi:hypothetical protein